MYLVPLNYSQASVQEETTIAVAPLLSSEVFSIQRVEHLNAKYLLILLHNPSIALNQQINMTSFLRNLFAKICHHIEYRYY